LGVLALKIFSSSTFTELGMVSAFGEERGTESVLENTGGTVSFTWAETIVLAVKEVTIKRRIL
jgi:hypothetical protein